MAKKKAPKITQKMSAKSKKLTTPKSNVRVVEADSTKRARKNRESFYNTEKAKSGATARTKASEVMRENKERRKSITGGMKPKTVVKVRSGGTVRGGVGRAGGLGGGMNWSTK